MKRVITLLAVAVLAILPAQAQNYEEANVGAILEILQNRIGLVIENTNIEPTDVEPTNVEVADVDITEAATADVEVEEAEEVTDIATEVVAEADMVADAKKPRRVREDGTRFLPMSRRVDRNIDVNKFVYRNEWMVGLTASYGTLSVANSDLLLLLEDINIGLKRTTVRPFLAYAYRDNRAVGIRMGYEMIRGNLDNISLNLGEEADLAFSFGGFGLGSESMSVALFHRNYMGFDRRGIVGMIIESELLVKSGLTTVTTGSGDSAKSSKSQNFSAKLNLNPGLAVYVFPEVCVTVTVGIGGLSYNSIRQLDASGVETGRRQRSFMRFKVNIADIQIGVVAHLWNKKKK